MPSNGSLTNPAAIELAAKKAKALELRSEGKTFDEIAQELGYAGRQGAYEAVRSAIKEITREPAQELLTLDLERLDKCFAMFYLGAQSGDHMALASMIRIMDKRHRLLGMEAPVKTESKATIEQHNHGGVLVVPGMLDEESWLQKAKEQQAALAEKEAKVLETLPAGTNKTRRRVE